MVEQLTKTLTEIAVKLKLILKLSKLIKNVESEISLPFCNMSLMTRYLEYQCREFEIMEVV